MEGRKSRNTPGIRKPTAQLFGVSLSHVMEKQRATGLRLPIPLVVQDCVSYLVREALGVEGIFRVAGPKAEIATIVAKYNLGEAPDLSTSSNPHVVTALLKQYLRELPESVIPLAILKRFEQWEQDAQPDMFELRRIVFLIPENHRRLLECIVTLLLVTSKHSETNQMTINSLAVIIAPNLVRQKSTSINVDIFNLPSRFLELLIRNYGIFTTDEDDWARMHLSEEKYQEFQQKHKEELEHEKEQLLLSERHINLVHSFPPADHPSENRIASTLRSVLSFLEEELVQLGSEHSNPPLSDPSLGLASPRNALRSQELIHRIELLQHAIGFYESPQVAHSSMQYETDSDAGSVSERFRHNPLHADMEPDSAYASQNLDETHPHHFADVPQSAEVELLKELVESQKRDLDLYSKQIETLQSSLARIDQQHREAVEKCHSLEEALEQRNTIVQQHELSQASMQAEVVHLQGLVKHYQEQLAGKDERPAQERSSMLSALGKRHSRRAKAESMQPQLKQESPAHGAVNQDIVTPPSNDTDSLSASDSDSEYAETNEDAVDLEPNEKLSHLVRQIRQLQSENNRLSVALLKSQDELQAAQTSLNLAAEGLITPHLPSVLLTNGTSDHSLAPSDSSPISAISESPQPQTSPMDIVTLQTQLTSLEATNKQLAIELANARQSKQTDPTDAQSQLAALSTQLHAYQKDLERVCEVIQSSIGTIEKHNARGQPQNIRSPVSLARYLESLVHGMLAYLNEQSDFVLSLYEELEVETSQTLAALLIKVSDLKTSETALKIQLSTAQSGAQEFETVVSRMRAILDDYVKDSAEDDAPHVSMTGLSSVSGMMIAIKSALDSQHTQRQRLETVVKDQSLEILRLQELLQTLETRSNHEQGSTELKSASEEKDLDSNPGLSVQFLHDVIKTYNMLLQIDSADAPTIPDDFDRLESTGLTLADVRRYWAAIHRCVESSVQISRLGQVMHPVICKRAEMTQPLATVWDEVGLPHDVPEDLLTFHKQLLHCVLLPVHMLIECEDWMDQIATACHSRLSSADSVSSLSFVQKVMLISSAVESQIGTENLSQDKITSLEKELRSAVSQLDSLRQSNATLESENVALKDWTKDVKELEEELDMLQRDASQSRELQTKIQHLEEEIVSLRSQLRTGGLTAETRANKELAERLERLEHENKRLQHVDADVVRLEEKVYQLTSRNMELESEVLRLEGVENQLTLLDQLEEENAHLRRLEEEFTRTKSSERGLQERVAELERALAEEKVKDNRDTQAHGKVSSDSDSSGDSNDGQRNPRTRVLRLKATVAGLQQTVTDLESLRTQADQVPVLQRELDRLRSIERLHEQTAALAQHLEEKLDVSEAEVAILRARLEQVSSQNHHDQGMQIKCDELQKSIHSLEEQIYSYRQQEAMWNEVSDRLAQSEQQSNHIQQLNLEIRQMEDSIASLPALQDELGKLGQKCADLDASLIQANKDISDMQLENKRLLAVEQQLNTTESTVNALREKNDILCHELDRLQPFEQEAIELRTLQGENRRLQSFATECERLQKQVVSLEGTIGELEFEIERLRQVEASAERLWPLESVLHQRETRIHELEAANQALRLSDVSRSRTEQESQGILDAKAAEITQLQGLLSVAEQRNVHLEQEIARLGKAVNMSLDATTLDVPTKRSWSNPDSNDSSQARVGGSSWRQGAGTSEYDHSKVRAMEATINRLQTEIRDLELKSSQVERENIKLRSHEPRLYASRSQDQDAARLRIVEAENHGLRVALREAEEANARLQNEVAKLRGAVASSETVEQLESEITGLRKVASEVVKTRDAIKRLESRCKELESSHKRLEELEREFVRYNIQPSQFSELAQARQDYLRMQEQHRQAKEYIAESDVEVARLQRLQIQSKSIDAVEVELSTARSRIALLEAANRGLEGRLDGLTKSLEAKDTALVGLEERNTRLVGQIRELEAEIAHWKNMDERLEQLRQLEGEVARMKSQTGESRLERLEADHTKLQRLEQQHRELDHELHSVRCERDLLSQETKQLRKERDLYKASYNSLQGDYSSALDALDQMRLKLKDAQEYGRKESAERNKLQDEVVDLTVKQQQRQEKENKTLTTTSSVSASASVSSETFVYAAGSVRPIGTLGAVRSHVVYPTHVVIPPQPVFTHSLLNQSVASVESQAPRSLQRAFTFQGVSSVMDELGPHPDNRSEISAGSYPIEAMGEFSTSSTPAESQLGRRPSHSLVPLSRVLHERDAPQQSFAPIRLAEASQQSSLHPSFQQQQQLQYSQSQGTINRSTLSVPRVLSPQQPFPNQRHSASFVPQSAGRR
eukprot:TRINITY_DN8155_c0_g1_i1.p1 TRINITY_DN8155_c0_g1~~TRINITY_DN8155_c0_g1_i1.p1  ORF type:complete len:2312 (-),score=461.71 TRINITY_DN8155_c0_g1_i1:560-7495(-)